MVVAVAFYEALGFQLLYGGEDAGFTSFRVGSGYLNLELDTGGASRGASRVESCSGSMTWMRCIAACRGRV
jgi:hypothetical protein